MPLSDWLATLSDPYAAFVRLFLYTVDYMLSMSGFVFHPHLRDKHEKRKYIPRTILGSSRPLDVQQTTKLFEQ